ncbi:hypothetical protein CTAYLR_007335 [Chrysophaeum taylorii]|uniref:Sulfotransferase n=1 Tax=Chrysophaeum taylorii TaxID=2483200 RepID=A0AAD7XKQ4_9STRA|nr:hypothetical protein CTAYLR_007335 [Chrysophaeum taylorii]
MRLLILLRVASVRIALTRGVALEEGPCEWRFQELRMRERAEALLNMLNATHASEVFGEESQEGRWPNDLAAPLDHKFYEIVVCRPLGVAFVHVYKSAGTTGMQLMQASCDPEPIDAYVTWPCDKDQGKNRRCHYGSSVAEIFSNVTTTFTIVRDPVERFQSGIFEVATRQSTFIRTLMKRAADNKVTVAESMIDILLARQVKVNPHLQPQIYFLNHGGAALPGLRYVALVGAKFTKELTTLARVLNLRADPYKLPKLRDSHDPAYHPEFNGIRSEYLSQHVRAKIFKFYHLDYAWLGGFHYQPWH